MTQKKFEVINYYQDLPELGNRALNLLVILCGFYSLKISVL